MHCRIAKPNLSNLFEKLCDTANKLITDTLSKNYLATFSIHEPRLQSHEKSVLDTLETDSKLFAEMYISTKRRHGDMTDLFRHEKCFLLANPIE
mgnify:CR=1 FL=1